MAYYPETSQLYTFLWSKYRPAVLKHMVDSDNGPQQYQFLSHEFKSINPKEKGGYSFTLEVFKGKPVNDIRKSVLAKDLLVILQKSPRAMEMFESAVYTFEMNKQFLLSITKSEAPAPKEEENPESTEEKAAD